MSKPLKDYFRSPVTITYEQRKKFKLVHEIMSSDVATIPHDSTPYDAAKIMGKRHIGSVIVENEGLPVGIFTESDLLSKVIAADEDPRSTKVEKVMSTPLLTVNPHATIKEAAQSMIRLKGKLIIMRESKVQGIVTASDLVKTMPDVEETKVPVSDFMTKRIVNVDFTATLGEVAKLMGQKRIGSLIIQKGSEPYGIFTERDLLSKVLLSDVSLTGEVASFASRPMIVISPNTSVHRAAVTMKTEHVRRLPVMEEEISFYLAGIVTARDLVEAYAK